MMENNIDSNMGSDPVGPDAVLQQRARKAIVVVDIVESVRLMQHDEAGVIERWRRFVGEVRSEVLAVPGGRLVKSLGDGLLLEFEDVASALAAAIDIQGRVPPYNRGRAASAAMQLRIGLHVADVVVDELDIFGTGVNLTARLATLAQPGEIVLSDDARDRVDVAQEALLEDLGPCWLKHIDEPVRAFRLPAQDAPPAAPGPARAAWPVAGSVAASPRPSHAPEPAAGPGAAPERLTTSVAVLPLTCHAGAAADLVVGELIADAVIVQLSQSAELSVLSRLSTSRLQRLSSNPDEVARLAGVRYVLSGSFAVRDNVVAFAVELSDTRSGMVCWSDRIGCRVGDLLQVPSEPLSLVASKAHRAILDREAQLAAMQPLPNLESFSLLYGGVGLLHHASERDITQAHAVLTALSERVPRHAASHAWLSKWHCLRVIRGRASTTSPDASKAQWHVQRALERDPDSGLAWALYGLVQAWVDKSLDGAEAAYARALACNPSEALAWVFTCTLRSWQGRGAEAAIAGQRALDLTQADPMRYYYETLAAAGYLADGQHRRAVELCSHSLRSNRAHTPTHRVLAIAQVFDGQVDAARDTVRDMLVLQPNMTAARFLDTYPGGGSQHAASYARALQEAGLPAA